MMIELAISILIRSEQRIIRMKQDKGLDAEQIPRMEDSEVDGERQEGIL